MNSTTATVAPATPLQHRLWRAWQRAPGLPTDHIGLALRVRGALSAAALQRSLGALVRRHAALRVTLAVRDGELVQQVAPPGAVDLPVRDLFTVDPRYRVAEAARLARDGVRRPFDLGRGPLLRAGLVRLDPTDYVLYVALHQVVADCWSVQILLSELDRHYAAAISAAGAGQTGLAEPAEPPVQFPDFAARQRESLDEPADLRYWREALHGAGWPLELPTDRPRPAERTHAGAVYRFRLDPRDVAAVTAVGREHGATGFIALLAAWQVLLHRRTGRPDIVLGTPVANRVWPGTEQAIGGFGNLLVLRTSLAGAPSFRDVLARACLAAVDAFDHQELPFERLVEQLGYGPDTDPGSLVSTTFTVVDDEPWPRRLFGTAATPVDVHPGVARFDLAVWLDGNRGQVEYATELFDQATVARLMVDYRALLARLGREPDRPVRELDVVESPHPEPAGPGAGGAAAQPDRPAAVPVTTTELERRIAAIWRDVLGTDRVGADENFFDLGGSSQLAVRVCTRLGEALGVPVRTIILFECPTVHSLAERLRAGGPESARPAPEPADRGDRLAAGRRLLTRRPARRDPDQAG